MKQRGVESFTLSSPQIENFSTYLVKAIVTGNIAFTFVENPHLMEAMATVGGPTTTRRQLTDQWIPALAEEASVATVATLQHALLVDASTDGWRKKYCEEGAASNNIVALLPDRALFHDAVTCSSTRKVAEAIGKILMTSAKSLMGSSGADLGWLGAGQHQGKLACHAGARGRSPQVDHAWLLCTRHCTAHEGLLQVQARYPTRSRNPNLGHEVGRGNEIANSLHCTESGVHRCSVVL
jgi:hypothetical protein